MNFTSFNTDGDTYVGNPAREELKHLPPGSYTLSYQSETNQLFFNKFDMNYDKLIDLPSMEYDYVMGRIDMFQKPETKKAFDDYGFVYKWNCLLYGTFGTGKTCLVNRVAEKIVSQGGIVLFNPDPRFLELAFKILDDVQKDRMTMVIFEEFDTTLARHEGALLSLLDGEVQKRNVVYMATTNHFENIPGRLKRPGRFNTLLEVKYPNAAARKKYLSVKLKAEDAHEIPEWVKLTKGLSIDELKETVQSVKCFNYPLKDVVKRILDNRVKSEGSPEVSEDEELDPDVIENMLQGAVTNLTGLISAPTFTAALRLPPQNPAPAPLPKGER